MKILFIGVFTRTSTNFSQERALRELGNNVETLPYRDLIVEIGLEKTEKAIIEASIKHDLIIFSKCNGISSDVVKKCNENAKTLLWYMDPLHNFNLELIDKVCLCHYTCCALHDPYQLAMRYTDSAYFVHEGFDEQTFKPIEGINKTYDVSFIGSLYAHRQSYYDQFNFKVFLNAYNEEHNKIVCSSKINLNFTHGGCSDRVYKVLAAKGFLLTQPWPKMENDFIVGKDLDIFTDPKSLQNKIDYYLEAYQERSRIANQGYQTVQKFTRKHWAKRIMEIVS